MTLSLVRWRMSGSKPPSSRQVRLVISSQPVPRWPVVQASPASSASGTASRWRRAAGWSAGRTRWTGSRCRSLAVDARRPRARLVLPLVGEHEVDVPERERGQRLLGLGLDELAAQVRRVARERPHRRDARAASRPTGTRRSGRGRRRCPRPPASSASASSARSSSASAWRTSTSAASVRRTPRPARSSSGTPGLALEHRELLGDGGRRELQRVGDGGDRAARVQLVQQAQPAEVEHSLGTLLIQRQEIKVASARFVGHDRRHALPRRPPLPRLRRRLRRDGDLRQARLRGGRDRRHAAGRPLRARRRAVLASSPRSRAARAACARCRAATSASRSRSARSATAPRPAATSRRSSASTRRCSRCSSTRSPRSWRWPRSRSAASGRAGAPPPRWRSPRPGSCSCWRARPPARSTRSARRSASRPRSSTAPTSSARRASPRASARSPSSALVCTGAAATLTLGGVARRRPATRARVSAAGYGWLAGIAVVSTVGAVGLFFAGLRRVGPTAASILSTLEPVVTVVLAFAVFGESLGPAQLAGGALVARWRSLRRPASRSDRSTPASGAELARDAACNVRSADRQGGPRGRRDPRRRARHRGRAGRGRRDGLLHRPHHPGAALGVRPAGDDRGDRRARRRRRRRRASPSRSTTSSRRRSRRSSRASTPSRAASTCSSTTSGAASSWPSGTRRSGSTTSTAACGCCAWRSTRT